MTQRKQEPNQPLPRQDNAKPSQPARRRWPLGIMVYGALTALGGLALLVVD